MRDEGLRQKWPTLLDWDWLELGLPLPLTLAEREALGTRLSADVRFLASQKLLDYSLLVGVCEPGLFGGWRAARYRRRDRGTRMLVCRDRGFLVVGLIDVLQPWTWAKVAEYYCRGALRG